MADACVLVKHYINCKEYGEFSSDNPATLN
jgi:hypothetical protein